MKPLRLLLALIPLLLLSCSMMQEGPNSDSIVNVGDPLPTFTLTMSDGTELTTTDLIGRPSIIILFSTTCPDCQRELPKLNQRYLQHGQDTTFLAISRAEGPETVTPYWQTHNLQLPYSAQPDRTIYTLFARQGIPRLYISNPHNIITQVIAP